MKRRAFATFAVAVLSTIVLANSFALAAQNTGNNWPSRSCGCSGAGKCYIANRNPPKDSECLPDGSAGNACSGVCSFTTHDPDTSGGVIMRGNVAPGGNSIGNAQ